MSEEFSDEKLEAITRGFQDCVHDDNAQGAKGGVVTRWVAVIEVMTVDGRKWLLRLDQDAGGRRLVQWDRRGLLQEGLIDSEWKEEPEE